MSNYVVLSSKSWNNNLHQIMKSKFPKDNWILINTKSDFNKENLHKIQPDFIFIPHWSHIIPRTIFENYKCIVFHMTDLPFGRGGSPLQNLITRGLKKTKITAIDVVDKIDAGDVYLKKELTLYGTAEEIFLRANNVIVNMIEEIIENKLLPKPQKGSPVFFKRRTPKMSMISEQIDTVEGLYDHIRMLDADGYPKAFIETEFFRFEFTKPVLKTNDIILGDVKIIKKEIKED